MLKNHEKFWAFIALLAMVGLIALPSLIWDLDEARVTLADKTINGLIGILGVAAGLLFRHSATEETLVQTNKTLADTAQQTAPQQVEVVNTSANPAVTTDVAAAPTAPTDEADAPWNKLK